jgi:hypothetical protein
VLPDFFALGENDLVVFNLVGHHLKFVAHPKEVYQRFFADESRTCSNQTASAPMPTRPQRST